MMQAALWVLTLYLIILNTVTTYRLLKDDTYVTAQKIMQTLIIWCFPLIGAMFVAYFLNALPVKPTNWWQRHWLSAGLLSLLFHIRYPKKSADGYSSDMNAFGDYNGGWYDDGFGGFGDGGAFGDSSD